MYYLKKLKLVFLTNSLIFLCIIVAFIGGISKKLLMDINGGAGTKWRVVLMS